MEINLLQEFQPQSRWFGFNTNHMVAILGATLLMFAFTFVNNDLKLQSIFSIRSGAATAESVLSEKQNSIKMQFMSERLINEFVESELGQADTELINSGSSSASSDVISDQPLSGITVSTGFAPRGPLINPR
jgi:hypothetical protein